MPDNTPKPAKGWSAPSAKGEARAEKRPAKGWSAPSAKGEARAEKRSAKGRSERRRKQQACNARRNKPWESATGPRTEAGKKASRMNAVKHGYRAAGYAALREALRLNREFVRHVLAYNTATQELDRILANKRNEGKASKIKDNPQG